MVKNKYDGFKAVEEYKKSLNKQGILNMIKEEDPFTSPLDKQIGGDHYKKLGKYQPWEVLDKWMTPEELKGFAKGTVISYLAREEDKGGRTDIEKAWHTLGLYLELTK